MARWRDRRNKQGVKAQVLKTKKQPDVDQVAGSKIPKSFVFAGGKLSVPLKQLELDLHKLMLPYAALKLKEKKRNNLKDFFKCSGAHGRCP